jgi:hypothetical protein
MEVGLDGKPLGFLKAALDNTGLDERHLSFLMGFHAMPSSSWGSYSPLVFPAGFEPTAPRLGIWCSIRLSYGNPRGT